MKKQVVNVSALQSAKVMAALYFVCSFPFIVILALSAFAGEQQSPGLVILILMPVLYAFFGFLFTLIGAWVYNLIAARIGGFEFTTAEVAEHS